MEGVAWHWWQSWIGFDQIERADWDEEEKTRQRIRQRYVPYWDGKGVTYERDKMGRVVILNWIAIN